MMWRDFLSNPLEKHISDLVHVPDGQGKPYCANGRVYVHIDKQVHEATG